MDASGAAHDNSLVMLEERVLAGACAGGRRVMPHLIDVFTHSTVLFLFLCDEDHTGLFEECACIFVYEGGGCWGARRGERERAEDLTVVSVSRVCAISCAPSPRSAR